MTVKDEGYSGAQEKPLTQTGGVRRDLLTKRRRNFPGKGGRGYRTGENIPEKSKFLKHECAP